MQADHLPTLADLRPMLLDERKYQPFSHPDWLFELKYDGYRLLAQFGDGAVEMRTRNGHNCTGWFPEVAVALRKVAGGPYIVDGEVCVLDDLGRSDFERLQARAVRRAAYPGCDPVVYAMFDLLVADGATVMDRPLTERKERLLRLFTPPPKSSLLVVTAVPENGTELFAAAVELELEGLVAKKADSVYRPGLRTPDWRKIKRKGAVPPERFKRRDQNPKGGPLAVM